MSRDDDLERQLKAFGATLREEVGEPIAPATEATRPPGGPETADGPDGRDRHRWVVLAAATAVVALVVGLLAVVQVDDAPDAPVTTQPPAPNPTVAPSSPSAPSSAPSSSAAVPPPDAPEVTLIDHTVIVDGDAVGEPWTTGVANTAGELTTLWGELGLEGTAPTVDFANSVVLYFNPAESGSCRFGPLDGVAHDPVSGLVFPVLAIDPPSSEDCADDANPHAILVQLARGDLPATEFVVWVENSDPPPGVADGVTFVGAGELLTPPPTGPAAPARPDQLVAINADGDAVLLADPSAAPVVLFDGPSQAEVDATVEGPGPNVADHVSVTPDGSLAFVGTCCEPVSGQYLVTEPPTLATYDGPRFSSAGYNPTVSPGGTFLAVASVSAVVAVSELATERPLAIVNTSGIPDDLVGAFTPYDVAWSAPATFAVLGIYEGDWIVVPGNVDDDAVVLSQLFSIGSFDPDVLAPFQFAGYRADGGLLVHRTGDATATAFEPDGTEAGVIDLGRPSLSAWLEPDRPALLVDDEGTLTVGELVVSGEYRWARSGPVVR